MKRIFAILSLLFVPTFVWAGDACTNPSEYTIDKRCYVTDEQKQQKPYNAVVGIINKYDEIDCTGTIVRVNDKLFLYTAKHCALYLFTKVSKNLKFKTIDNQEIMADLLTSGDFVEDWFGEYENPDGDWAVYSFKEQNIPFVNISDKNTDDKSFSVGYGTLNILNDKQIKNIKKQYFEYMRKGENQYGEKVRLNKTEDPEWGIVSNGGLKTNHPSVDVFIQRYFIIPSKQNDGSRPSSGGPSFRLYLLYKTL